jgi:hypothetical protein
MFPESNVQRICGCNRQHCLFEVVLLRLALTATSREMPCA